MAKRNISRKSSRKSKKQIGQLDAKKLDFSKYLYYVKGTNVMSYHKKSRSKKIIQKGLPKKEEGRMRYITGEGKILESDMVTR